MNSPDRMSENQPLQKTQAVGALPKGGQSVAFKTSEAERTAIATFLDLPSVEALEATFDLVPSRGGVRVTGTVKARLHQLCVVTMEPFPVEVEEEVDVRFAPEEALGPASGKEIERKLTDEDPPEPLVGGAIDLGALAVESISLGLDPFPRKPGAEPVDVTIGEMQESPFAVLAALKKDQ